MTRLTAKDLMNIWMAPNISVTGWKTNSMVTELKLGQISPSTKVIMSTEKNMVSALLHGPTRVHT